MANLIQSVEVLEVSSDLEDAIANELKEALSSLKVGSGVRAVLAPGTNESLRVKKLTRRINKVLAPSRFTARLRGDALYVERIA